MNMGFEHRLAIFVLQLSFVVEIINCQYSFEKELPVEYTFTKSK